MYCALNFVDDTSLWINKNCSAYEVREGIGDLSEHELYKTKLICFNKLHLEYYHITYEFTYTMNDRRMLIMTGFMELRGKVYLTFSSLGVDKVFCEVPIELLTCKLRNSSEFLDNSVALFFVERFLRISLGVRVEGSLRKYLSGGF